MASNTFFFTTIEPFFLILCVIGHWNVALSHINNIFRVEIRFKKMCILCNDNHFTSLQS